MELGPIWRALLRNKTGAILIALQMAVIYVPWLNPIFKTAPLPATELVVCLAAASIMFIAVEGHKWFLRCGRSNSVTPEHTAQRPQL